MGAVTGVGFLYTRPSCQRYLQFSPAFISTQVIAFSLQTFSHVEYISCMDSKNSYTLTASHSLRSSPGGKVTLSIMSPGIKSWNRSFSSSTVSSCRPPLSVFVTLIVRVLAAGMWFFDFYSISRVFPFDFGHIYFIRA
eukprot:XP_001710047.1 Hypothetical protein GL50803_31582 [Giardia lamblia ATCC 50803]